MVLMVRALYQRCRLVHADLSEYNVLVHDNTLYCIDVSQAVELDHPRAFDFLREGELCGPGGGCFPWWLFPLVAVSTVALRRKWPVGFLREGGWAGRGGRGRAARRQ